MSTARNRSRRELEANQWEADQRRRRNLTIGGIVAAVLLFVAVLVYLVVQEITPEDLPGEAVPIQGQEHIQPGLPHEPYNSNPPTSGPHYPTPAEAGFYEEAPLDEALVHNLEHGHVIIWYNCSELSPEACQTLKDQIRDVMSRGGVSLITGTSKINAVPRTNMATTIALTSWGRLQRLDAFDRDAILRFIREFRDNAPENGAP
jgi:hypothetical protein